MTRVAVRQLSVLGVVLLLLAIACRFADLDQATEMVDNLAIIVSGTLVLVTAGYGWFNRGREPLDAKKTRGRNGDR